MYQAYLERMTKNARSIMDSLGIPYKKRAKVMIGTFTSNYGLCTYNPNKSPKYKIEIAEWLLKTKNDEAVINTIIHEYLHTIDPKVHHTGAWKRYANIVNKNTNYTIQRCTSYTEFGITDEDMLVGVNWKYKAVCKHCGSVSYFTRNCKFIKANGEGYHCGKCKHKEFEITKR